MKTKNILLLLLLLTGSSVITMELPQSPTQSTTIIPLQNLPPDLQRYLLPFLGSGNVNTSAKTIVALAGTNRWCRAFVNKPETMLLMLESYPYTAHALEVAEKCGKMPVMASPQINSWWEERRGNLTLGSALIIAAKNDMQETIKKLLKVKDIDLNGYFSLNDSNALTESAERGHLEVVDILLAAGVNVNRSAGRYSTALISASRNGHIGVMQKLITAGADPNEKNLMTDETPLLVAVYNGKEEAVRVLLAAGADINKQARYGRTGLMAAATKGHVPVMRILLQAGAKEDLKDEGGNTALDLYRRKLGMEVLRA